MREMVLNHASLQVSSQNQFYGWIVEITQGISVLSKEQIVKLKLRIAKPLNDIFCLPNQSFYDLILKDPEYSREYRDARLFFVRLTQKYPLLSGLSSSLESEFLGVELNSAALDSKDGEPIVLCALNKWISISFPIGNWDSDLLNVQYHKIMKDSSFEVVETQIDNLARADHANGIINRQKDQTLSQLQSFENLWEKKEIIFPNLLFGLNVENQIRKLPNGLLTTVSHKLKGLDQTAEKWKVEKTPNPNWVTKVTPESTKSMQSDQFRQERMFQSRDGTQKLYELHARFGSSGRIHLRIEHGTRIIEIGYIGWHLPSD